MAFICEPCLSRRVVSRVRGKKKLYGKRQAKSDFSWRSVSFGPCENCRRSRLCLSNG